MTLSGEIRLAKRAARSSLLAMIRAASIVRVFRDLPSSFYAPSVSVCLGDS